MPDHFGEELMSPSLSQASDLVPGCLTHHISAPCINCLPGLSQPAMVTVESIC